MFKNRPERPVAFNVGMGIGKALEVGGQYYNDVAVELRNQEALEEARQYQTSEREAGENFQERLELDRQKFQTEAASIENDRSVEAATDLFDRQVLRDDTLNKNAEGAATTAFNREKELTELENKTVANTETVRFDQLTIEDQLGFANRIGMSTEEMKSLADEKTPMQVNYDANGDVINVLSQDQAYIKTADGWELTTRASNSPSAREGEYKTASQFVMFNQGMEDLDEVLQSYDLTSGQAALDQGIEIAGSVGNWALSPEGQLYRSAITRVNEALFKNLSGAAGSDAEAARFESMLPSRGDKPLTIQYKMRALERIAKQMKSAGFNGLETGERAKEAWTQVKGFAEQEIKFDKAGNNVFANTDVDFLKKEILIDDTVIDLGDEFSKYRDGASSSFYRQSRLADPYAAGQD